MYPVPCSVMLNKICYEIFTEGVLKSTNKNSGGYNAKCFEIFFDFNFLAHHTSKRWNDSKR